MNLIFAIQIILVFALEHECTNAFRLNLTSLIGNSLGSRYHVVPQSHHEYPSIMLRDMSYLPESDYIDDEFDEQTQKQQKQQQQLYNIHYGDSTREKLFRDGRNVMAQDYQNLCETHTRKVQLSDSEFEYQPPYYHEVYCKSYLLFDQSLQNSVKPAKQICAHPGFHCIQRSRTLFVARRQWSNDCWVPFTKEIASGCDCMWPVNMLGDIAAHY